MNRRDFLRKMGLPVLTAAGILIAAGIREPASAGKKGRRNSGGGGNQSQGSSGTGNSSNVSTLDFGSSRITTDKGQQGQKGLMPNPFDNW